MGLGLARRRGNGLRDRLGSNRHFGFGRLGRRPKAKGQGSKVTDLLFAKLATDPGLMEFTRMRSGAKSRARARVKL